MNTLSSTKQIKDTDKNFSDYHKKVTSINKEINKHIFGQEKVIEQILISLPFSNLILRLKLIILK